MRDKRGMEYNSTVPQFNGSAPADKSDSGGKRKGRSMKKRPKTFKHAKVSMDNLRTARDNGGYLNGDLNCVVYFRTEDS
jgi:hypothetical protein